MTRLIIDTGTEGNSATGDTLRTAMAKINDNFEEVYNDLAGASLGGQLTNPETNGDVIIQPNGTGIVEVDQLQINNDAITSLITNSDLTLSGNGTGGVKVSGVLNVDDGISITDNIITSSASNENLELSASGSGEVTTDTNFKLVSATPFLKIQRTDNANVPGIDFIGQAGTSGAKVLFDGTGGTANELIFQTFTVSGGLAEAFRVTGEGAKVSGILTVPDGSATDNYVGVGDADDLKIFHNGSHSIIRETGTGNLFLQSDNNVILGKDSSSETMVKGIADGAVELYHDNTKKFETTANGVSVTGRVDVETVTTGSTENLTLSTNAGTNSGTIVITDGTNGDITLETDGTGDILLKAGGQVGIGSVSSPDTDLHIKKPNAQITLQRTADANTPGISFQQSGGNVRAELMMDGTSGTSNEVFVKTHDGSSLAERFRVGHTKTSVAGNLEVSGTQIDFTNLPTSDPGVAGRLYRDGTTVKISV